ETRYIEGQGRYALAEMVGRGGFATVWRARSLKGYLRGKDVAVKVIPVYSAGERSRALREGQIAEGLRHKNIVETLEVIPGDHEIYLVTEYVRGMPLDEAAKGYRVDEIVDSLAQILEALVYAHGQGIIHRDIKPQNALVDARGRVKLTDFGVAFRAGDTRLTRVGFAVGTPGYIAPEILDGADPTALTDIYAVGATARTLLASQPYEPTPRLKEFVDRATSPNPAHRPQSAWAAVKLLTGRKAPAGSISPARRKAPGSLSDSFKDGALRIINGVAAGWLGYLLAARMLDGAQAVGIAAGLGVLAYLLPRLGALGVIVALAVLLIRSGAGLGFAALAPLLGGVWVMGAGSANVDVRRLPLGPALAVPLALLLGLGTLLGTTLVAGLPLLFGALMRPLGACLSAAAGAFTLICYDLTVRNGFFANGNPYAELPYSGVRLDAVPTTLGVGDLLAWSQAILQFYPQLPLLFLLWAAMAGAVSLAEWAGKWVIGLAVAVVGGALGYALLVSPNAPPGTLALDMISLGLAAIIYGVLRYLASRVRG
ncbi:MAG: serine/threonine protein kinase, partial [Actinomycetota bacterium]|nr:serine/threonine protein kinase [Actinomycetota bacterium]